MSEGATGNGIAFAFSGAAKKPIRKLDLHERANAPKKDILTGIGPDGGLQSAEQHAAPSGPKIIPKQENTYKSVPYYLIKTANNLFSNFILCTCLKHPLILTISISHLMAAGRLGQATCPATSPREQQKRKPSRKGLITSKQQSMIPQ